MKTFGLGVLLATAIMLAACGADPASRSLTPPAAFAMPDPTCVPLTEADLGRVRLALDVMDNFPPDSSIFVGAMDVFGNPRERFDGPALCIPPELKDEVTKRTVASRAWGGPLLGQARLRLAGQLGPRDPAIIRAVANAAFVDRPIEEGPFTDLRPMARSVLASFGRAAAPWRAQALSAMNSKDALGTSAAQVAAASGDRAAVDQVAALLDQSLTKAPASRPIPVELGDRLVELSLGLGVAADVARPHVPLLVSFLNRDVLVGSHFGALVVPPREVCRALRAIGGKQASAAVEGPRCRR